MEMGMRMELDLELDMDMDMPGIRNETLILGSADFELEIDFGSGFEKEMMESTRVSAKQSVQYLIPALAFES